MVKKRVLHGKQRRQAYNCMTCANARLMQWDADPIISQCRVSGFREVASAPIPSACAGRYEQARRLPLDIERFSKHANDGTRQ